MDKKMKANFMLRCLFMAAVMTVAGNAGAQDLKSVLSGVVKNVVGDKTTTASSIIGTWTYAGPECQFESDNLLAKAGGEVAAKEVEEKIQKVQPQRIAHCSPGECRAAGCRLCLTVHAPSRVALSRRDSACAADGRGSCRPARTHGRSARR